MKTKTFLILIFAVLFIIPNASATDTEVTITDITEDGYTQNQLGVYTKDNTSNTWWSGITGNDIRRGYAEFNITGLQNATLDGVTFLYEGATNIGHDADLTLVTSRPSTTAINTLYWNIGNGTVIGSEAGFPVDAIQQSLTLNDAAVTSLQAALTAGQTWWAVGFYGLNETGPESTARLYSEEHVGANPAPSLLIRYTGIYSYNFSGGYYENGNVSGAVTVTVTSQNDTESFSLSGEETKTFNVEPILFTWEIGGASTRRVYSVGSENFTVTIPDADFNTYSFTIRDFTGKTAKGSAYLESWRFINGTETLIERQIIDIYNAVPLNLVEGASYGIRIRFSDGSVFNWGVFVPGQTDTFTIILRGVEITEQAYLIGNFIYVEITRPTDTQLTIDYLTSRNTTIWSNVTIAIRGGAVIDTQSFNNESYTYNYAGAVANTSYVVLVNGEHTLQTTWAFSKTFDGVETYPDVPDVELIFPMGGLDASNLIAWVFTLVGGLTFTVIYRKASLLVMCALGSFFSAFGFADWSFNLLAVCWFFSFMVYLGSGD